MIRAPGIFRSVTFWSGILVMAFICWAWADSMRTAIYVSAFRSRMHSAGGEMSLTRWPGRAPHSPRIWGRKAGRYKIVDGLPDSVATAPVKAGESVAVFKKPRLSRAGNTVYVPYWTILFAVALPWNGLLLWREARRRRAFTPIKTDPAES